MLSMYPACFYKEKDGQYTVIFPDLNHLATCGTDLQDAMKMATDCLQASFTKQSSAMRLLLHLLN